MRTWILLHMPRAHSLTTCASSRRIPLHKFHCMWNKRQVLLHMPRALWSTTCVLSTLILLHTPRALRSTTCVLSTLVLPHASNTLVHYLCFEHTSSSTCLEHFGSLLVFWTHESSTPRTSSTLFLLHMPWPHVVLLHVPPAHMPTLTVQCTTVYRNGVTACTV